MATKLETFKALSDATMQRITSSRKNWMDYLDATAWLYKYPFCDQLMIYAQRPDARACAPIELWNSVFKRWVKRGSKGIALIDDSGDRLKLRYVFDVSDTSTRSEIPFKLWAVESEHQAQILEELTNRFGAIDSAGDFVEQLREIALNVVMDNVGDYADVMPFIADGSRLVGMDHREILDRFITTVAEGVIYTVLARVGLNPRELKPP
ncbi:MAG: DEAD/DEAH box helicase, partial [Clostridiaceae bacterium]